MTTQPMPSIYRKKNSPYWYIQATDPQTGKRRNVSLHVESEQKARRIANLVDAAIRIHKMPQPPSQEAFQKALFVLRGYKIVRQKEVELNTESEGKRSTRALAGRKGTLPYYIMNNNIVKKKIERGGDVYSQHLRHMKSLNEFIEMTGITNAADVDSVAVYSYVEKLEREGLKYDTIRHRLMYIRLACKMAGNLCIDGLQLHKRAHREAPKSFTSEELIICLEALKGTESGLLVALCGTMGLRSTEAYSLTLTEGNLANKTINVGRKNAYSVRELPCTKVVLDRLPNTTGRVFPHNRYNTTRAHTAAIQALEGVQNLQTKHWRKTYATLARHKWNLNHYHIERMMGHAASDVTSINYDSGVKTEALWESVKIIDGWIEKEARKLREK
jgi:integrase